MHELSQIPNLNVSVKQIRARLEYDQASDSTTIKELSSCNNNFIEQRKVLFEGGKINTEQNAPKLKQKPVVARKPCKSPTSIISSVSPVDVLNKGISEDGFSPKNTASRATPTSSNIVSDSDAQRHHTKVRSAVAFYDGLVESGQMVSPTVFPGPRDSSLDQQRTGSRKKSNFGQLFHAVTMEELKNNVFKGTSARTSKDVIVHDSNTDASSKMRKMMTGKQNLESNCESMLSCDSEATSSRPSSEACSTISTLCRTSIDKRLKKLHYAAVEIYTVEKKFVEQLELLAVKYPEFLTEYGKKLGIDLLKPLPNGHPHLISQIAQQLLMVKEAHKFLLEKISSKIENWDSRDPNMAECLKNGAGLLKCCLPYLKEKKKHVDDFIRLLQDNEELAHATVKFEEQVMGKISIIQQLDIVHQNVVRYTILLEAYKKHLIPESDEFEVCKEALVQLSKVSELVDRQISRAELEKRLIDLYRRLEGRFNVFEANRHLLFEGELMKQSRKDLQPRYLILFSDVLLICKYSRTPSLGTDANFHSEFYKFLVSRIRVKAEEHGEYETHFQLYTTQKSAVFIAKTKRERDDWVKRINEAKMEAKELRRIKIARNKVFNVRVIHKNEPAGKSTSDAKMSNNGSDHNVSLNNMPISGKHKYTPLWIPDPKATSCMMAGCSTKFNVLNRRHHCRECGYLICRSCVGYAPVKTNSYYMRSKVCPECYVKITKKWKGELGSTIFTAPENESLTKTSVPSRNAEGVVSGTVFLRNQKGGENEKWGRLTSHADGVLVLCFYNAEFDVHPVARYVLLGFTFCVQELDDGGRLFELRHANQVNDRNSISLHFRVAHSGSAERWYKTLKSALGNDSTIFS
ncbi:PH domain protein [Onchocerca flexuosa]|uniref:PH domain protein n=1 Tax=Onchocerca flexuosa TaxID=387005 RepID=A0A238BZB4_9BILA|nr:PH domain protein [Onchocerca flexuosa]